MAYFGIAMPPKAGFAISVSSFVFDGAASAGLDKVGLDGIEIVLGRGLDHAEHGAGLQRAAALA
jgi:hypothetical protein